jgi:GntR family transcriptional repressor for pyruvate dehydrogenase complex
MMMQQIQQELGTKEVASSLKRLTRQQPLYSQVVEQIRQLIKEGELTPGDQLLPERELAEKLGVSRTSIRQALAVLEGMGVIEINPRDGAYVRQRSLEGAVESLTQVLFQEREQVKHSFEVRWIIETQAVRLAAERRTEADLERLQELNRRFASGLQAGDLAFDANMEFHLGIVETAKNPLLTEIMGTILTATVEVYALARRQSLASSSNLSKFVNEHEQIISAIAQQNPDLAASLLGRHIDDARKRVEMVVEKDFKKGP